MPIGIQGYQTLPPFSILIFALVDTKNLLWTVNSGKAAAKRQRVVVLTAIALAAYLGYAAIKNVHMPWYTKKILFFAIIVSTFYNHTV